MKNEITESEFQGSICDDPEMLNIIYGLRYRVFVENLEWVSRKASKKIECDEYDKYAVHIVVHKSNQVYGYLRIIRGGEGEGRFMLENDFKMLVPFGRKINQTGSLEVTRICTEPSLKSTDRLATSMILYKTAYLWSLTNDIDLWHVVVTEVYLRNLIKIGFPFKLVHRGNVSDKHGESVYATLSLHEAILRMSNENPSLYSWFSSE